MMQFAFTVMYILNNATATNATTTTGLLQWINGGVHGLLGEAILFMLFVIISGSLSFKIDMTVAAFAGSMIMAFSSVLLVAISISPTWTPLLFVAIAIITGTAMLFKRGNSPYSN